MSEIIRDEAVDNKTKTLFAKFRVEEATTEILIQKYGSERAYELAVQIANNPGLLEKKLEVDGYTSRNLAFFISQLDFSPEQIDEAIKFAKEVAKEAKPKKDKKNDKKEEVTEVEQATKVKFPDGYELTNGDKRTIARKTEILVNEAMKDVNIKVDANTIRLARKEKFNTDFTKLNRNDFANDDEYRKALQDQYVAMKKQQWEYATLESAFSYHNVARAVPNESRKAFSYVTQQSGAKKAIKQNNLVSKVSPASMDVEDWMTPMTSEYYEQGAIFQLGVPNYQDGGYSGPSNTADCAESSAKYVAEACENMGEYGGKNLVKDLSDRICSAKEIHEQFKNFYGSKYSNYDQAGGMAAKSKKTLEQLIAEGTLGPGAVYSVSSSRAASGHHAMYVVSVERNKDGSLKSYILADNNGGNETTRLISCKPGSSHGKKRVLYSAVNKMKEDEFIAEVQNASIEQLEKMIETTHNEVTRHGGLIDQLGQEEFIFMVATNWKKTCGSTKRANMLSNFVSDYKDNIFEPQGKELIRANMYAKYEPIALKEHVKFVERKLEEAKKPKMSGVIGIITEVPTDAVVFPTENMSEVDRYAYEREQLEKLLYPKKDENFFDKIKSLFKGKETNKGLSPELVDFAKAKIENLKYLEEQAKLKESMKEMSLAVNEANLANDVRTTQSVKDEIKQMEEYKKANKGSMSKEDLANVDAYIKSLKNEEKFRKKMEEKGFDDDLHKSLAEVAREVNGIDVEEKANEHQTGVEFKRQNAAATEPAKKTVTLSKNQGR